MEQDKHTTVAVIMGGFSSEREVSLHSGEGVAAALREAGFGVVDVDLHESDLDALRGLEFDVAFIALHGEFGEDGRIQGLLEEAGIPYTGSGPVASRDAMDKVVSKRKFAEAGIPMPDYIVLDAVPADDLADQITQRLSTRLVVKPSAQGSSIGVSIVGPEDLGCAVSKALEFDGRAIVERYVSGRELTVGIVGERALSVIELRPTTDFFDYEAKYTKGRTHYIVNPDIPREIDEAARTYALEAFNCLGCRDLARVDMVY
jgi:D-alanine-D-alanine ligase